jgi:hypothetical protein
VPAPFVISLTLQPLVSLSFGTNYRLELRDTIVDEDGELLVPYTTRFSTFLPEEVGESQESDKPTVTGLVILGERGYVLETVHGGGVAGPQQGRRPRHDDDPVAPRDRPTRRFGTMDPDRLRPRHRGEEVKGGRLATGEKLIAVQRRPAHVLPGPGQRPSGPGEHACELFLRRERPDATPRWVGAANITNNVVTASRTAPSQQRAASTRRIFPAASRSSARPTCASASWSKEPLRPNSRLTRSSRGRAQPRRDRPDDPSEGPERPEHKVVQRPEVWTSV